MKQVNHTFDKKRLTPHKIESRHDPIVVAVTKKLLNRSDVGIEKYKTTLAENTEDNYLKHLQEELMDACNYIEARMTHEQDLKKKVNKIIDKALDEHQGMETSTRTRLYIVLKDIKEQINNIKV